MTQDNPNFFLGRTVDPATGKAGDQPLFYDPANLTTHGIITGMTGSGKTGLGIGILEEAALKGIPAIIIDPKGDLTNLLLHFPELRPADFEPWIDPEAARREGKPLSQLAEETATRWRDGLAGWGIGREQILKLQESVEYTVFTPGSSAGVPVNILAEFAAPDLDWATNKEVLREKISTIVSALLNLVGVGDVDPLRSREHILLSNIIESAWAKGEPLDLTSLIVQTQKPPFERLGAFPLDNFYPEKDRFELAMLLNNFLASPSFQTWLEGQALDAGSLLFGASGKPRHNIFYLAHLSETERHFFVTLLFAAVESWMRSQRGTGSLRLLIYFDEIMGYLPPIGNPPPRTVMLRMLKQARAFGVGLLLATQNPVDVDYKALSNAGTWMIGRLQTEQDKNRLMDGLKSASGAADLDWIDRTISGLGKRVFLLHSIYNPKPLLFTTRWAMNFLAGPLTRSQIPALNQMGRASLPAASTPVATVSYAAAPSVPVESKPRAKADAAAAGATSRPVVPTGIEEVFLPNSLGVSQALDAARAGAGESRGILYKAALYAQGEVRFLLRKYNLDQSQRIACLVVEHPNGRFDWPPNRVEPYEARALHTQPLPGTRFDELPTWMSDPKRWNALKKDFEDWLYQDGAIRLRANEELKVYAGPDVSEAEFRQMCSDAARDAMRAEQQKVEAGFRTKLNTLRQKLDKQKLEVEELRDDLNARRLEEGLTGLQTIAGLFGGRKRSLSTNASKRRMTAKTGNQLQQAQADLESLTRQLKDLEDDQKAALEQVEEAWARKVGEISELPVAPTRTNIFTEQFALAWAPYYLVETAGGMIEVPAFGK
jgi:hypothetical protein